MELTRKRLLHTTTLILLIPSVASTYAQSRPDAPVGEAILTSPPYLKQTAEILGLTAQLDKLESLRSQPTCGSPGSTEELLLRQEVLESIEASSLEVDGVLAEINSERNSLSDVRAALQNRRDHAVALTSTANLITGTGLGILVNAMQFKDSTALAGDGIGVGSGVASTILSIVAIRQQRGPQQGIGTAPNMLAPLFDQKPVLYTYYPPEVLSFLHAAPFGQQPSRGTRLEQLMAKWTTEGRLDATDSSKRQQKIEQLTTSMSNTVKLSIDDITDRSVMLGDVSGRVSLLKRDMAALMRAQKTISSSCGPSDVPH